MKKPVGKPFVSTERKNRKIRGYKAAVFLQLGVSTNYVHTVSTSDVPALPKGRSYQKKDGKAHTSLCGRELCDIVKAYKKWRAKQRLPATFTLVLDRDPSHVSKEFREYCDKHGVKIQLLPPRSHDLSPPDSHFFGQVKNKHARWASAHSNADWDKKCLELQRLLQCTSAEPHIRDYELKLKACKKAKGQRFGNELRELRAAQRKRSGRQRSANAGPSKKMRQ
jgi:hypothetical protein